MTPRWAQLLVDRSLLSPAELEAARRISSERGAPLADCIAAIGALTEDQVSAATAEEAGLELVFPYAISVDRGLLARFGGSWLARHEALPLHEDEGAVVLAFARPPDARTLADAERQGRTRVRPVLAAPRRIAAILDELLSARDLAAPRGAPAGRARGDDAGETRRVRVDPAAILLLYGRIAAALRSGAREVRFEPDAAEQRIRVRVRPSPGAPLEEAGREPYERLTALVARARILAGLAGTGPERGELPRTRTEIGGRRVELAVSVLPTRDGDAVRVGVRALEAPPDSLDALPLAPEERGRLAAAVESGRGLVLLEAGDDHEASLALYAIGRAAGPDRRAVVSLERGAFAHEPRFRQVDAPHGAPLDDWVAACLAHAPDVLLVGEPLEGAPLRALAAFARRGLAALPAAPLGGAVEGALLVRLGARA